MRRAAIVLMLVTMPLIAEELKLGKPINVTPVTAISELLAKPEAYVDKTVLIEGTIAEVCQNMGCWINVKDTRTGEILQIKVNDGDIVFPKEAVGKKAVAQGTFTKQVMTRDRLIASLKHEAEESGKKFDPSTVKEGKTVYQIKGSGAVIR